METVKYLCEFFFTNFWHWLGLFFIVLAIFEGGLIRNIKVIDKSVNKEKEDTSGPN